MQQTWIEFTINLFDEIIIYCIVYIRMKVLYAIPIFLDYRIPLFKRLDKLFDGEFNVLYSPKRYQNRFPKVLDKINEEIPHIVHEFNGDKVFNTDTKSFDKFSYKGKNIVLTFGLIRKLMKLSPHMVITEGFLGWTPFVLLYCVLFHRKLIVHYERTCHTERNVPWYIKLQRKFFNLFIDGYLVNGTETKKYLKSIGVKEGKIHLAGMSADTQIKQLVNSLSASQITTIEHKYHVNRNGIVYLYVGRISCAKGADRLINAWEKHIQKFPSDCLIMAGDGELVNEYKNKKIANLQLLGRVNYDSIYELYAIADAFVIATMQDNWSLVVPEAMSCGIPVATSIYNGCHTDLIIEGKTGFVFNPTIEQEIVDTLEKFHHCNLVEMGKHAMEIEKNFDVEATANRICRVFAAI